MSVPDKLLSQMFNKGVDLVPVMLDTSWPEKKEVGLSINIFFNPLEVINTTAQFISSNFRKDETAS